MTPYPEYDPYNPDEAWDMPPYIPPGGEGYEGLMGQLDAYGDIDYGNIQDPIPIMQMIGQTFGMGNIIQYMKNQFSGKNIGGRVDKYRDLGMGQVNRGFTGAYDKLRGKSASEGGRQSSYAAAAKAKGTAALVGARADVEGNAMNYEDMLRKQAWERGTGVAGMLESAIRGDEASQRASLSQMMQQAGLQQNALDAQTGIYGDIAGMEQSEADRQMLYNQLVWEMQHGGNKDDIMNLIGQIVSGGAQYAIATA